MIREKFFTQHVSRITNEVTHDDPFPTSPVHHLHPAQMAMHLLRRVMMAGLLMNQPIQRDEMMAFCLKRPWPYDYAPIVGEAPEKLLNCLLDEFIERGLVSVTDSGLTSFIPI